MSVQIFHRRVMKESINVWLPIKKTQLKEQLIFGLEVCCTFLYPSRMALWQRGCSSTLGYFLQHRLRLNSTVMQRQWKQPLWFLVSRMSKKKQLLSQSFPKETTIIDAGLVSFLPRNDKTAISAVMISFGMQQVYYPL